MKNLYVKDLKEGLSLFAEDFALRKVTKAVKKDGKPYLRLELSDKTGNIDGNMWTPTASSDSLAEGSVVSIDAKIESYNGKLQLNVSNMVMSESSTPADFMAVSKFDIPEMWEELLEYKAKIKNKYLIATLDATFTPEVIGNFKRSAAAMGVHHAYQGGLLEHTLEMLKMSDSLSSSYPGINQDMLITGIIVHDLGKIVEYITDLTIKISTNGKLLGHIFIGAEMIRAASPKDMPEDLLNELLHMILAHHGELEFGSPVKPRTVEAIAISRFDDTSAKINAAYNTIQALEAGTEFTAYHRHLGVELYNSPYLNELVNEDIPF